MIQTEISDWDENSRNKNMAERVGFEPTVPA